MTEKPKKEESNESEGEPKEEKKQQAQGIPPPIQPQDMRPTKEDMDKAPAGVKILAILYVVGALLWFVDAFLYTFYLSGYFRSELGYVPWANYFVNVACCWIGAVIIAGVYTTIAGGLIKGMRGAWFWALIFAVIGLLNFPIGTFFNIIILVYLFKVKDYFKN